jgi:hypothetical protein
MVLPSWVVGCWFTQTPRSTPTTGFTNGCRLLTRADGEHDPLLGAEHGAADSVDVRVRPRSECVQVEQPALAIDVDDDGARYD